MSTTTATTRTNRSGAPTAEPRAAAAGRTDAAPATGRHAPVADAPAVDAPDARSARETAPEPPGSRHLSIDGIEWIAWVSGAGATGTGARGLALIESVHFAPATNSDHRPREALIARGRFSSLFDDELLALFRTATPIAAAPPPPNDGRRNGRRR